MFYAGLDPGKRHSYLAVVDEGGRTVRQLVWRAPPRGSWPPSPAWPGG